MRGHSCGSHCKQWVDQFVSLLQSFNTENFLYFIMTAGCEVRVTQLWKHTAWLYSPHCIHTLCPDTKFHTAIQGMWTPEHISQVYFQTSCTEGIALHTSSGITIPGDQLCSTSWLFRHWRTKVIVSTRIEYVQPIYTHLLNLMENVNISQQSLTYILRPLEHSD